jgi:hypothetical protein
MIKDEAIGWVVRAYEGNGCRKQHHEQKFLFQDHGVEAEVKARAHHKHIRDLYPESAVELNYLFGPVTLPKLSGTQ